MLHRKILIRTFGCALNQSDSELMGGLLKDAGFDVSIVCTGNDTAGNDFADSCRNADFDVVIINSCTVKNLAESKFFKELRFWYGRDVKIIVAGCIPQADPGLLDDVLKDVSVLGTRQLTHIVEFANDALEGKIGHNISVDSNISTRLDLPNMRKNKTIEIIPISEGCTGNCSYCKTKFARGNLVSYPKEKIISRFKRALDDGCREFWITSQDNGCYGMDIYREEKYFLPQLLDDLLDLEGDFRIRLGMCNPDHVDRIKEDLVRVFNHPKMFKFLHIPVQSGSSKVLKDMRRSYTVSGFKRILKLFRDNVRGITISTDIIIGFPGETDQDFEDTVRLIEDSHFDVLNISRFWARKGTDAAKLKQLPTKMVVERLKRAKQLFDVLAGNNNSTWRHKELRVLADERLANGMLVCRNDSYKRILLPDEGPVCLGDFFDVKIVAAKKYCLVAELIRDD